MGDDEGGGDERLGGSAEGPAIELELDGFPLIVSRYRRTPSEEDFVAFEARLRAEVYKPGRRFVNVADLSAIRLADPSVRRSGAAMAERVAPLTRVHCIASVLVVRSPIVRGIITAIRWITSPSSPEYSAASPRDAADIARRCLEQDGVELSAGALAALERLRTES